jgi:hypothetical protein
VSFASFAALWGVIVGVPLAAEVILPHFGFFQVHRPAHLSERDVRAHLRWRRRIDLLLVVLTFPFPVLVVATVGARFAFEVARLLFLVPGPNAVIYPPLEDFHGALLWGVPALVLGTVAWGVAHTVALRLLLTEEQLERYKGALLLRHGRNQLVLGRLAVAWLVPLTLIAVFLTYDCYLRVEPDRIVVNEFLGFGETEYNYSDVLAVVETTHARTYFPRRRFRGFREREVESRRLWVLFKDGGEWVVTRPELIDHVKADLEQWRGKATFRRRHLEDLPREQLANP